jgi:hypothetical protein
MTHAHVTPPIDQLLSIAAEHAGEKPPTPRAPAPSKPEKRKPAPPAAPAPPPPAAPRRERLDRDGFSLYDPSWRRPACLTVPSNSSIELGGGVAHRHDKEDPYGLRTAARLTVPPRD